MKFDLPKEQSSIIKVIGVGGGGSNAVNHMFHQGIKGVEFVICNTDNQALDISPVPHKIQLGEALTQGLGAGSLPEIGKQAAIETIEAIKTFLAKDTKMVFITAGMGGGTGTGAAPIIASAAKELGILTVGIVTIPFSFEGRKRKLQAEEGLEELRRSVDTLLVINNDKLREMYCNLSLKEAFAKADNVLTTASKGIAEVITVTGLVNVDFNDVNTVMNNGGTAIMGYADAEGEGRALKVAEQALACPLLNDNDIKGASQVLLYITSSTGEHEITMDEMGEITDYIQNEAGSTANVIFGVGYDESLGSKLRVIVIATGFTKNADLGLDAFNRVERKVYNLNDEVKPVQSAEVKGVPVSAPAPEIKAEEPVEAVEKTEEPYLKTTETDQVTFEFEVPKQETKEENKIVHVLDLSEEKPVPAEAKKEEKTIAQLESEEQERKAKERVMRIKEFNYRLRSSGNITDLENEPAYKRRNVQLDNVPHSSESNISKYTLSENEDKKTEIRPNNSFLHDNVD